MSEKIRQRSRSKEAQNQIRDLKDLGALRDELIPKQNIELDTDQIIRDTLGAVAEEKPKKRTTSEKKPKPKRWRRTENTMRETTEGEWRSILEQAESKGPDLGKGAEETSLPLRPVRARSKDVSSAPNYPEDLMEARQEEKEMRRRKARQEQLPHQQQQTEKQPQAPVAPTPAVQPPEALHGGFMPVLEHVQEAQQAREEKGPIGMQHINRRQTLRDSIAQAQSGPHSSIGEPLDTKAHDRTLAEIFADPTEQTLFLNHFVYAKDPETAQQIFDNLSTGALLTPKQEAMLEKLRPLYNERRAVVEHIQTIMTPSEVERIASTNRDIARVVGAIGAQRAANLLQGQVPQLAMGNPRVFKKVVDSFTASHTLQTSPETQELEHEVHDALQKYNIPEEEYTQITQVDKGEITQDALQASLRRHASWGSAALDLFSFGISSRVRAEKLYAQFRYEQALLAESKAHLANAGRALADIVKNDETRAMIQRMMLEGGSAAEKNLDTVHTVADYRDVQKHIKTRGERFAEFSARPENKNKDRAAALDIFSAQELAYIQKKKGRGVIAVLLRLLFGVQTKDSIKQSLSH